MTAWQRIGSICTTDSAAGPEKLRQKAMAKSTAIHVFGANFHLVQNRLKVDVTPISINSVKKLRMSALQDALISRNYLIFIRKGFLHFYAIAPVKMAVRLVFAASVCSSSLSMLVLQLYLYCSYRLLCVESNTTKCRGSSAPPPVSLGEQLLPLFRRPCCR